MKTSVTVTQEHVDDQSAGDCWNCAFALALNEKLAPNLGLSAYVIEDRWRLLDAGDYRLLTRPLSSESRKVIFCLDHNQPTELPHTFITDIPRKYLRQS